jgi:hypothetical protein
MSRAGLNLMTELLSLTAKAWELPRLDLGREG